MVNVRALANLGSTRVNKNIQAIRQRSTGSATAPDGSRTPIYNEVPVTLQIQALTYTDIIKLDALNIQGARRAIYTNGAVFAVIRVAQKGGDLIIFPNNTLPEGNVWLAAHVLEQWNDGAGNPSWVKVAITLQDGS